MWAKKLHRAIRTERSIELQQKSLAPSPKISTLLIALKENCFQHLRTYYNGPQKIWQTIWKLEIKVVIDDKTRVGCAIVAFHMRNWLITKYLKSWINLELCLMNGHEAPPSSCSYQIELIEPRKSTVARFSTFTWRMLVIEITFFLVEQTPLLRAIS